MTGTAKLEITGLSGIDNNFEIPEEILVADWNHFPPARVISAQRVDRTFYVPVSDSFPNFAQILFQPTVYTLRVKLAVEASVTTGNDQQGNPLAASGSASFAAPLENVPPGPREPKIYMQDGKAFVVGIQFLDEHLNVLDPAPGEADVRSSSGSPFPVLGSVLPWLSGGDNFDDNKQDTGIWGNTVGTGSLHEVEFSLEYRAASSGIHSAAWPLKSNRAPLTESWEMQADVHLEPMMLANLNNSYGAGFIVSSGTHTAGVRMERFLNGAATEGRFRGVGTGPLQPQESSAPAPRTDGAVRLSYNALTKVLSYWYDPDGAQAGYAWTLLQKTELGPLGWNLPPGTLLAVTLGGSSNGPSIPAGTVWMDNFNASSWEPVTASLSEVELAGPHVKLTGVAEPDLPLTLQASDNLTDWASISQFTPSRDGFLNFTTPTDRSARFFRLRY
ncbi:MAG TPA: hypothetical protein VG796_14895 [Verrucomicrobiales bacterium]|nr:hypothetical protein [Verrucomicrobiales bacterium]